MTVSVDHIRDPLTRQHCRTMEHFADRWREATARINELAQDQQRLRDLYPFPSIEFKRRMAMTIDSMRLLKHESDQMRSLDSSIRLLGLEARRAGKPVTANPFAKTVAVDDSDDPEPYATVVDERAAIPWYIGWKQGARTGEKNLPE